MNILFEVTGQEELVKRLDVAMQKIDNKNELFNRFSPYVNRYIRDTIDMRGRPADSWPPLAPLTIALRRNKDKNTIKPLVDKGLYRASFHELGRGKDYVDNGTADKRGHTLNFGGNTKPQTITTNIPAYTAKAKHPRYHKESWKVRAHVKVMHLDSKVVPARPHVFLGADAIAWLVKTTEDYINEQAIQNS